MYGLRKETFWLMRQILTGYWGKYKNSLILTPIFVLLETVVTLALPTLMSNIVDQGVATGDRSYIIVCGLLMTALALVSVTAGFISTCKASRAQRRMNSISSSSGSRPHLRSDCEPPPPPPETSP